MKSIFWAPVISGVSVVFAAVMVGAFAFPAVAASVKFTKPLDLRCTGELKTQKHAPIVSRLDTFEDASFDITIQIRDGLASDVASRDLLGSNCFLEDGTLGCSFDTTVYLSKDRMSERKQGIVMIDRATGGIQMLHTVWYFEGKSEQTNATLLTFEKVQRDGICQVVEAKPLF